MIFMGSVHGQESLVNPHSTIESEEIQVLPKPFFGTDIEVDGLEMASPSITADGKTIVFALYENWQKKVPYLAQFKNGEWQKERLEFVDTLYNLAISPDGQTIIYTSKNGSLHNVSQSTYSVEKENGTWGTPKELKTLSSMDAGYFQLLENSFLFFYASTPREGIYFSVLDEYGEYSSPQWFSDIVNLKNTTSFDVLMHPDGDRLLVSQYYDEKEHPELGEPGLYFYALENSEWVRKKRVPIEYCWGANITPDGKLISVLDGKIQFIPIEKAGIEL